MELSKIHIPIEECPVDKGNGTSKSNIHQTNDTLPSPIAEKKNKLTDFSERTTFHGIRYIVEEGSVLRRLVWLVLTIGGACAVGYQIYERVSFYGSWPVNVNVEINYNKTLQFPAVTICNQNSFKATKAAEFGLYDLIEDVFSKSTIFPLEHIKRYNASNIPVEDLFMNLGHAKQDLFVSCTWQNTQCNTKDFTEIVTDHGLCYTFSPKAREMTVSAPGINSGLQLLLNIEQYEYINGPHDGAGVKVMLHNPRQTPLVASLGQAVSTGVTAFAGINLLIIDYQLPPYGNCGSKPLNHTDLYTAEECFIDCMTTVVIEKCGCRDMYMIANDSSGPTKCNLEQYFSCIKEAQDEFYEMFEHRCNCPVSCEVTLFNPSFSEGSLSNHAVESLLSSDQKAFLFRKLLNASETKTKMNKRKHEEFQNLFKQLKELYKQFIDLLHTSATYLQNRIYMIDKSNTEFYDILSFLLWFHDCQKLVFSQGVLQNRDSVSNYLKESNEEFLYNWNQRFKLLLYTSNIEASNRNDIYTQTVKDLQLRKHQIKIAQGDIDSIFVSFNEGTIRSNISLSGFKNQSHVNHFVPQSAMNYILSVHSYNDDELFVRPVGKTIKDCIEKANSLYTNVSAAVDELLDLTETAFLNPDSDILSQESIKVMDRYASASFESDSCRDALDSKIFRGPINELQYVQDIFVRNAQQFNSVFSNAHRTLYYLEEVVHNTSLIMNSLSLKQFINTINEYVVSKEHTLMKIYSMLAGEDIQAAIMKLKYFSFEVDTREQALHENIDEMTDIHGLLMFNISDIRNEIYDVFYDLFNIELYLRNYTEAEIAYTEQLLQARDDLDIRKLLGDVDYDFIEAFDDILQYINDFIASVKVNSIFLKDNFLKLNVFYRQLSYEYVRQQKGYNIFGLICDIGGSMGLFIGASMLSVVEVIDLLLRQMPLFWKNTKRNSSDNNDTVHKA